MKYVHNIFIANSYIYGDRIAYDLVIPVDEMNKELDDDKKLDKVQNFLLNIYKEVGEGTLLTNHVVFTDTDKWDSVVDKDTFFKDIIEIKKVENFIKYLKENKELTEYDVKTFVVALTLDTELPDHEVDELVDSLSKKYLSMYNASLYAQLNKDKRKVLGKNTIRKCSNIILNRVLNSDNGFEKFNFILGEIRNKVGMPLIIG